MYRVTRQHRYNILINSGFLPSEAMRLSKLSMRKSPYIRTMMKDRHKLIHKLDNEAKTFNWSKARLQQERRNLIGYTYRERGFTTTDVTRGQMIDVWQLFRYYRDEAIQSGKWEETPRTRKHKRDEHGIRIDKGKIKEQKQRYRERQRMLKAQQARGY